MRGARRLPACLLPGRASPQPKPRSSPAFNAHGIAVTTQPAGPILVVNGPVRETLGLNGGMGALGPGTRANMTIGRALRLLLTLTGGARPGGLDRSTLGHPGKLGTCFAENEEASPWEPLHVERGFARDVSTVTLVAGDAPLSISDHRSTTPEELARNAGVGRGRPLEPVLVADGRHVAVRRSAPSTPSLFAAAGWSKEQVRTAMFDAVQRPAGELRRGETTALVHASADDAPVHKWTAPERIVIVVAGGEAGRFSAVFGPCDGMQAAGRDEGGRDGVREPDRRRTAEPVPFAAAARLARRASRRAARHHEEPRQRAARPDRAPPAAARCRDVPALEGDLLEACARAR